MVKNNLMNLYIGNTTLIIIVMLKKTSAKAHANVNKKIKNFSWYPKVVLFADMYNVSRS